MAEFPDAEAVVMAMLRPQGKTVNAIPPSDIVELPLIWVLRTGGGCDDDVTDRPLITVTVIHQTRPEAMSVATRCRDVILASGGTSVDGVLVDFAQEKTASVRRIDPMPKQPFFAATYQLSFRRQ